MAIIATLFVIFPYQKTPLHVAASNRRDYTVECLTKKKADINIKDITGVGENIPNSFFEATTDLKLSAWLLAY